MQFITKPTFKSFLLKLLPTFSVLAFISIPLFLSKRDVWDGAIVRSGLKLGDFEGWRIVASESGWDAIYFIATAKAQIAQATGLQYENIHAIYVSAIVLVICYSSAGILTKLFFVSEKQALLTAALIPVIPVWNVTLSSGMDAQIFYLAAGLFGISLFLGSQKQLKWVGLPLIVLSFEYSTLVLFIPAITWVSNSIKTKKVFQISIYFVIVSALAISYFIFQKISDGPIGRYSTYNSFVFEGSRERLFDFSTFLLIDVVALFITALSIYKFKLSSIDQSKWTNSWVILISSFLLFLSSCLPHVLVGKSVTLWKTDDWEGRYALTTAIAVALIFGLILSMGVWNTRSLVSRFQIALFAVFIVGLSWMTIYSFAYKLNQQLFFEDFISELKSSGIEISPGLIHISGSGIPGPEIRTYEFNLLFQESYGGKPMWFVGDAAPVWSEKDYNYYFMDVYFPSKTYCVTDLVVNADGYLGNRAIANNLLGVNSQKSIEINTTLISCENR